MSKCIIIAGTLHFSMRKSKICVSLKKKKSCCRGPPGKAHEHFFNYLQLLEAEPSPGKCFTKKAEVLSALTF